MASEEGSESWDNIETPEEAIKYFTETVFQFADVIINLCVDAGEKKIVIKLKVITALLKLFEHERLMQHYVNFVLNMKDEIDDRNDHFFLTNDHIYPGAPPEDIEFFRSLWREESDFHLNSDEKETVFEYFDTMLDYCQEWKDMTGFVAEWEKDSEEADNDNNR